MSLVTDVVEENIAVVMKNLEDTVNNEQITMSNILSLCINSMQCVEKIPKLSGPEKKQVVIEALRRLILKTNCDENLLVVIPNFIDTAVQIEKGNLKISMDVEDVAGCCAAVCGALAKKQSRKK